MVGSRVSQRRQIMERRISDRRIFNYDLYIPERRNLSYDRRSGKDRRRGEDRRQIVNLE